MGYEDFRQTGERSFVTTFFEATSAPGPIVDPVTGAVTGWKPGTGVYKTNSSSGTYLPVVGYRSSVSTPGFNSPKRQSLLKPQSFDFSVAKVSGNRATQSWVVSTSVLTGPGSSAYYDSKDFEFGPNSLPFVVDPTPGWATSLRGKAISNLLKNLRNSSFNAAQAVAERKQTADLVASTATRVAKSLSNLRRGNFGKAAQDLGVIPKKRAGRRFNSQYATDQSKAIGNAWLELQYGWKPLLADVYGSMETLARANNPAGNPNTIYKRVSGRGRKTDNVRSVFKTTLPSGYVGSDETVATGDFFVSVHAGVTYSISSAPLASMASVGITNPALLAWELLPYSFVVDWFLPIGNYLESLDASAGCSFYSGFITTMVRKKYTSRWYSRYSYSPDRKSVV